MNGKKAKALRRLNPQTKADSGHAADKRNMANALDAVNRGGFYLLAFDKDHLENPAAASGIRVMNRIIDEGMWPSEKVVTVLASLDMTIQTKNAFSARREPPWAYMAERLCPDAQIFVLIQDQNLPDQTVMLSVGWCDPHDLCVSKNR
ncbi:hypothetical protein [Acidithiobacillus thiooxidans]|uniref:Uncharacterized protein n=1 Tax=Acidithiobacillus thiooxidans TaxID=930 RepID=A0A1C2IQJ5_ACITH|nr:hypothetical protein [Acidithiobacillus thiooxidans]OCX75546.1 hypothetical protein A6M23_02015 [Acidithiobacillus thiooxidans]OCX78197.1 hypothetical protein A6P08_19980 [Acidithiobacillus thiooxidans]